MKKQELHFWFTLIEVLVSITIFSIMFISIIWIYVISTDINLKSDINRMMQENLKILSSKISEDIRKNWITWVSNSTTDTCDFLVWGNNYKVWDELCTKSGSKYYLAKKDKLSWEYLRTSSSECDNLTDNCVIAMWIHDPLTNSNSYDPLTNSYVSVKDVTFYLSSDYVPKVTMNIVLQPSSNKWVKPDLIKESNMIFQTTVSERPF